MKRKALFSSILFFLLTYFSIPGFCQFEERVSYFQPSPNASAVIKYSNTPVNMYTGVPSINATLITLKARGLDIPIELNYHASGIKVQDVASNVGLGWSMNATCMISRMVRGLPDESLKGYFGSDMGDRITHNMDTVTLNGIFNNTLDAEPDLFYYNINGKYGKFVFNKDKNPVLSSDEGIKVLNSPFKKELGIDGWILSDLFGNKFFFGMNQGSIETTLATAYGVSASQNQVQEFNSAWYLNKITTADNIETITYSYNSGSSISTRNYRKRMYFRNRITTTFNRAIYFLGIPIKKPSVDVDFDVVDRTEWNNDIEEVIISPKYLSSIVSSNQSAYFTYSPPNERLDLENGNKLIGIEVRNYNNELLNHFNLFYGYFVSYIDPRNGTVPFGGYRLKLDSIQAVSSMDRRIPLYKFYYNEAVNLPPRNSLHMDHWGYYNNNTLYRAFPDDINQNETYKQSDGERMKANILQKIVYQTGGYKEFVFEPNDYYNSNSNKNEIVGGLRVSKIISVGGSDTPPLVTRYDYSNYGKSTGLFLNKKPIYVSYIEHTQTQIPYTFIGFQPTGIPQNLLNVTQMTGDMVMPIPMKSTLITSLISSLPNLLAANHQPSSVVYTPYIINSSIAMNNLFDVDGSVVGYNQVTVENGENGKVVNKFLNIDDYPDFTNQIRVDKNFSTLGRLRPDISPFTPATSYNFARGKLKESLVYDKNSVLIKRIVNKYIFNAKADSVVGFKCAVGKIDLFNGAQIYNNTYYNVGYYYYISKPLLLTETSESTYAQQNSSPVIKTTQYYYNPNFPSLLSKQVVKNSDMVDQSIEYKYVVDKDQSTFDSQSEVDAVNNLYQDNRYGILLEQATKSGTETIEQNRIGFKSWYLNNKYLTLPESIYKGDGSVLERKMSFNNYDYYGNVLQQSLINGPKINYKWGNNSLYPVLEVGNSESNEIFIEDFENNQGSNVVSGIGNSGNRYHLGDYVTTYAPPNAKPYKISYWYLANGIWQNSGWLPYTGSSMILNQGDAIDDVVIIPSDSRAKQYTYKKEGIKSVTDINGRSTFYDYDDFLRLKALRDYNYDILKSYDYNDNPITVGKVYFNNPLEGQFSKNDCPSGLVSPPIFYSVPEGKYYSYLSLDDANSKAQQDLNVNGQKYANENGYCATSSDYSLTYTTDPYFSYGDYKITKSFQDNKRALCKVRIRYDMLNGSTYEGYEYVQLEAYDMEAQGSFQLGGGTYAEMEIIEVVFN